MKGKRNTLSGLAGEQKKEKEKNITYQHFKERKKTKKTRNG